MDCFPNIVTLIGCLMPISIPRNKKAYSQLVTSGRVSTFCTSYHHRKISFIQDTVYWDRKLIANFIRTGLEAQIVRIFQPERISWERILKRLDRGTSHRRINTDTRQSFKWDEHIFLVKGLFTFGQRTVPDNLFHVYQTTEAPILFFLLPPTVQHAFVRDFSLNVPDQFRYKRFILQPHQRYVIPSNTTYVLVTVQKTLFSVHVVAEHVEGHDPTECTQLEEQGQRSHHEEEEEEEDEEIIWIPLAGEFEAASQTDPSWLVDVTSSSWPLDAASSSSNVAPFCQEVQDAPLDLSAKPRTPETINVFLQELEKLGDELNQEIK